MLFAALLSVVALPTETEVNVDIPDSSVIVLINSPLALCTERELPL